MVIMMMYNNIQLSMAQLKGSFGPVTIAQDYVQAGMSRRTTQRQSNDPLNFIKIACDIPKQASYSIGSTDVFNFGEELQKIHITKYADILKIENQYNELMTKFKY